MTHTPPQNRDALFASAPDPGKIQGQGIDILRQGKRLVFILGLGVAIALLYQGMAGFAFSVFFSKFRDMPWWRLGVFIPPIGIAFWAKWRRWYLCLSQLDPTIDPKRVFKAQVLGFLGSTFLPFKAGEALKLAALKRKKHEILPVMSTIALDRFWDGSMLLLLFLWALLFFPAPTWMQGVVQAAAVVFLGGLAAVFACVFGMRAPPTPKAASPTSWQDRLLRHLHSVITGLYALRSWTLWGRMAALSLVNWVGEMVAVGSVFWAFGLTVPWYTSVVAVAAVNFASVAISVPASIGVFEFCVVATLVAVGVSETVAFGIAVALHGLMVLPLLLLGLYVLPEYTTLRRWTRLRFGP